MTRTQRAFREARQFVRDYTGGVETGDLRRLFESDAADAYRVLTRDQPQGEGTEGLLHRAKVLFLGLSYKLSPPRRVLFAASLLLVVLGLLGGPTFRLAAGERDVVIGFSPIYFLLAVGGLVYLLAVELVDRVRFRDELEVARELQRELLPRESPAVAGYSFAHSYRTANTIGGDYYDFLPLAEGRLGLAVGDASGHGIAAGLLMAIANAALKSALELDPDPRRILEAVHRVLTRTGGRRAFMTLFFAVLDPSRHRLEYACAGHPFPLLRRADGTVRELDTAGSLPLGLREEVAVRTGAAELAPGDLLVLFTDGLPEALDAEGRAFGFERLSALVAEGGAPQRLHDAILAAHRGHVGGLPATDDSTLVVVQRAA
ncbi:MAG: PP2C family protein-serine/threonine phosphatase [Chloroflexi bacterium]|nr:PP2C family protein-serine/threonine phosphatase [Chloroflexota bacterium]